jgi:hypothetical protein
MRTYSTAQTRKWDDAPTGLIHWGRTIVAGREPLKEDFEKPFGSKK